MTNIKLNKSKTLLCKQVVICIFRRGMELTIEDKRNAFALYAQLMRSYNIHNQALFDEGQIASQYIFANLEQKATFSQIIASSQENLGYTIHYQSFISIIKTTLNLLHSENTQLEIDFINQLHFSDDLNIFDHNTFSTLPGSQDRYNSVETIETPTIPIEAPVTPVETIETPTIPIEAPVTPVETIETSTPPLLVPDESKSITIPVNNSPKAFIEDSYGGLVNNGNNNEILIYTMIAFTAIVVLAYVVKKYNKGSEINAIEEEDSLNSVYETLIDINYILLQLLIAIIPPTLLLLYYYRYYYKFKLLKIFKKC